MEVRLLRLTPMDEPLAVTARVTRQTRKVIQCSSVLSLADGIAVAEGTATQFVVGGEQKQGRN
jgi:acyl-coenzyme A thioesterase PaaI-like protein